MTISIDRSIRRKVAAILGLACCVPFSIALLTAITSFKPLLDLISSNGRATPFGLVLFYIGLVGLPVAFFLNLASMLTVRIAVGKWSIEGRIALQPQPLNVVIAVVGLAIAVLFGGHLLADTLACFYGNLAACDERRKKCKEQNKGLLRRFYQRRFLEEVGMWSPTITENK
jgi:hypothetical protein